MTKQFTIKLMDKVFTSDEHGYLDLNDIWRGCNLDSKKQPSQWKSAYAKKLRQTENILSGNRIKELGKPPAPFTDASEKATIAYAMFVSSDFYEVVVEAFVALRNGEIEKAVELAADTMSAADAHYLKRQMKLKGMLFDEACAYAGIQHSRLCKQMLLSHPKFSYFDSQGNVEESETAEAYFYNRGNKFTDSVRLCVTPEGRKWMRDNREWFNKQTEAYKLNKNQPF